MPERLTTRDLHLMLSYFSREDQLVPRQRVSRHIDALEQELAQKEKALKLAEIALHQANNKLEDDTCRG